MRVTVPGCHRTACSSCTAPHAAAAPHSMQQLPPHSRQLVPRNGVSFHTPPVGVWCSMRRAADRIRRVCLCRVCRACRVCRSLKARGRICRGLLSRCHTHDALPSSLPPFLSFSLSLSLSLSLSSVYHTHGFVAVSSRGSNVCAPQASVPRVLPAVRVGPAAASLPWRPDCGCG